MSLIWKVALAALVACVVSPASTLAHGQAIDGIIEGSLNGEGDGAVAEAVATVPAVNAATGYERSVTTDQAGRYAMPLMPPGEYPVVVAAPPFATMSRTGLTLRAGQVLTVEFVLPLASFSEGIQVTADHPAVEEGRTVQSNTFEERTVRAIPTVGRSILDFFVLQPGVNAPPISSGRSGTGTPSTVSGAQNLRQMNVDGVSNNLQGGARNLVIRQECRPGVSDCHELLRRVRARGREASERVHTILVPGTISILYWCQAPIPERRVT